MKNVHPELVETLFSLLLFKWVNYSNSLYDYGLVLYDSIRI